MAKGGKSKVKAAKTFLKKGLLAPQIKARQKNREFAKKVETRKKRRGAPLKRPEDDNEDEEMDVDALLNAEDVSDVEPDEAEDDEAEADEDEEEADADDLASEADSLEGSEDESSEIDEAQHIAELQALAQKDPEFFKYLQQNDKELLDFGGGDDDESDEEDEDEQESEDEAPKAEKAPEVAVLTKEVLRGWQRSILQTSSLKSYRSLLKAFRSAARRGDETFVGEWQIQSAALYSKLISCTLRYTPLVLKHHVPYTESTINPGKFKVKTNSKQYVQANKLLKSFFHSLQTLVQTSSSNSEVSLLAIQEGTKLVPYIVGNRKLARAWTKMLMELYNSRAASDDIRLESFIGLRALAVAGDHTLRESVIKTVYSTLLATFKTAPTTYSAPGINLLKNTAAELFMLKGKQEMEMSYRLCFGYVRMLAILLRKAVKEGNKDSYKAVYNWQFVQALDFWSLVISNSCDSTRAQETGTESVLQPLIYPLVQVGLGAIRLVPTSRYFPLRMHLIRSILRIIQRTPTYIPLVPSLFEMLSAPDIATPARKPSKGGANGLLRPIDLEHYIRVPAQYLKSAVYADLVVEETVYYLTEYLAALSTSVAFPELALPALIGLSKTVKKMKGHGDEFATAGGSKGKKKGRGQSSTTAVGSVKMLVEKIEANVAFIEDKRAKLEFGPGKRAQIDGFLKDGDDVQTPLKSWIRIQRKTREQRKKLLERRGDDIVADNLED